MNAGHIRCRACAHALQQGCNAPSDDASKVLGCYASVPCSLNVVGSCVASDALLLVMGGQVPSEAGFAAASVFVADVTVPGCLGGRQQQACLALLFCYSIAAAAHTSSALGPMCHLICSPMNCAACFSAAFGFGLPRSVEHRCGPALVRMGKLMLVMPVAYVSVAAPVTCRSLAGPVGVYGYALV
jgi:hypothetical protein